VESLREYISLNKKSERRKVACYLAIRSIVGTSEIKLTTKNMIRARMIGAQSTADRHIREAIENDPIGQCIYNQLSDKVLHTLMQNLQKYFGVMEDGWQNKGVILSTNIRRKSKFDELANKMKNERKADNV
jgi:hypothetical protein